MDDATFERMQAVKNRFHAGRRGRRLWSVGVLGLGLAVSVEARVVARPSTFQERVDCRAIVEDVYWSQRLWPEANRSTKPERETVLPSAAIAERIEEALRFEAALEQIWDQPLTPTTLQREIERQARSSQDPEGLRALWRALGDDAGRVAECLVRPELAARLIQEAYSTDRALHAGVRERAERALEAAGRGEDPRESDGAESESVLLRVDGVSKEAWESEVAALSGYEIGAWAPLRESVNDYSSSAVVARTASEIHLATVRWPKRSFEDWWSSARARYRPVEPRSGTSYRLADLTGLAGLTGLGGLTGFGGRAALAAIDSSAGAATAPVPAAGGLPTNLEPPPLGRGDFSALWTGNEMLVWGGRYVVSAPKQGLRYNPATDTWSLMKLPDGPSDHPSYMGETAVWTGKEMILWGGLGRAAGNTNRGSRYNPANDSWSPTSIGPNAPAPRQNHVAVWTGTEMVVWGGHDQSPGSSFFNSGGRYDPVADSWAPTSIGPNTPPGRSGAAAVWTGHWMIVWGGFSGIDSGGRYAPETDTWEPLSTGPNGPGGRVGFSSVWTGTELVVWGGTVRGVPSSSGVRYTPTEDLWRPVNAGPGVPSPRTRHSAVWTGSAMVVWGGMDPSSKPLSTGARYELASDTWTPTAETGAPPARWGQGSVWTGELMIVWGGMSAFQYLPTSYPQAGGRYHPKADAWLPVSATAPMPHSPR